jgi:DNA-binding PadR family transcriptional regulator
MKVPRTGEMSSSMAVLGLVVQRPDTIAGVAFRLSETFPRAYWSPGAAHSNMPNLAKQGLLSVVQKGPEPTLDRYEATAKGIAEFSEWMVRSISLPPALRDGLQAKLEFIELGDPVALLRMVREAQRGCRLEYAEAHKRWRTFTNLESRHAREDLTPDEMLSHGLKGIQLMDEVMLWGTQAKRLTSLYDQLEGLLERVDLSSTENGSGDG